MASKLPSLRKTTNTGLNVVSLFVLALVFVSAVQSLSGQLKGRAAPARLQMTMMCGVDGLHRQVYKDATSVQSVALEPAVARLKQETEKRLGEPIVCLLEPGFFDLTPLHLYGYAGRSTKDGKPYIVIDEDNLDQTEIAHELFHWKLDTEGVSNGGFEVKVPPDIDSKVVYVANQQFTNLLYHRLFFDRMRAMGLDPTAKQRETFQRDVSNRDPAARTPYDHVMAVWSYVECATLIRDQRLTTQFGELLADIGHPEAASQGKRIAKAIARANPRTMKQMQAELAEDFTILFGVQFRASMVTPRPESPPPSKSQ